MGLKKIKIRLAAFGLAMMMGLFSVGNLPVVDAAEGAEGQKETIAQEEPVQETGSIQHRVVAENLTKSVKDKSFSVGTCLEGIQFDPDKEEVSFYKIIGDDGSEYQSGKVGTYTATYLVIPKDQSECYVVTRKITVTDTEGTAQVSDNGGQNQKTDTESEEDADSKTETESKVDVDSKKDTESKEDADSKNDTDSKEDADSKNDTESEKDAESKEDTESAEKPQETSGVKISLLKKDQDTDKPLADAVYAIYKDYQCKDILMELPATDQDGKTSSDPIDSELKQVYVEETKAPENYLLDSNVYPVDVESGEDVQMTVYEKPEKDAMEDTGIPFIKTDAVTGEPVEGAMLQVLDQVGNLVEEWTSEKDPHVITGLSEGEYILHEKQAPYEKGYVSASDIAFQVSKEEPVTEVEMKDEISKVDISAKDQSTGKELSGVTLQITGKDGRILTEWVTDGTPYHVEKLPVNEELTLRVMAVPEGYLLAKEMKFILTDTKEIQSIETRHARASEKASTSGKTTAPKTGDALHLPVILFLSGGLSAVVLVVMLIRRRKGGV